MEIFIISNPINYVNLRKHPEFKINLGKAIITSKNHNPVYDIPEQINLYGHISHRLIHQEGSYRGMNVYADYSLPANEIIFMNDTDKWEATIDTDIVTKIDNVLIKIKEELG